MMLRNAQVLLLFVLPQTIMAQAGGTRRGVPDHQAPSTASIVAKAIPATVTIISIGADGDTLAQGSGFLVRADGAIITNWHVMRGASNAVVILASHERYDRVRFLDGTEAADIAIIKIPGYDLPTLPIRSTVPAVGERVIAIGSPLGLSQTVTEGIVSATRMVDGRELVQISAPISPGSSGGAVLDGDGRVFAISTSYLEGGQQLNFAVPVRYALGLLSAHPVARALSEVFSTRAGSSQQLASSLAAQPTHAHVPNPRLAGAFRVSHIWHGPDISASRDTGLLIAHDRIGWEMYAPMRPGGTSRRTYVVNVRSFRTSQTGEVVLDMGGMVFDGFQTDGGGFFVTGTAKLAADEDTVDVSGSPANIKLSNPSGLYTINCHTQYITDSGVYVETVDWTGELAAAVANDSVYIDLSVANDVGGSTALTGSGPLDGNQSFSILSPENHGTGWTHGTTWLKGAIAGGLISGSWEDSRKDGKFTGSCYGERQ